MKWWTVLVLVLGLSVAGWAASVETTDGQILDGKRVTGIPDTITLTADGGVVILAKIEKLERIEFSNGGATVATTAGEALAGALSTSFHNVVLVTETGEVTIPAEKVKSISFSRKATQPATYSTTLTLTDGRLFEGELGQSFPDPIGIASAGITTTTRLRAVTSLKLGDIAVLETASSTVSGVLTTPLPAAVDLNTAFGSYRVPSGLISQVQISGPRASALSESELGRSLGIGLKAWLALPFLLGNLSWGNFGLEVGVGFGTASLAGLSLDVSALWYYGDARYLIALPLVQNVFRPFFGAGIVGVTVTASSGGTTLSGTLFGLAAFLGAELSFAPLGVPATAFGGVNWAFLAGASGGTYEFGVRVDFPF